MSRLSQDDCENFPKQLCQSGKCVTKSTVANVTPTVERTRCHLVAKMLIL